MKFLLSENWSIIDLFVIFGLVALLESGMFISAIALLIAASVIIAALKHRYIN